MDKRYFPVVFFKTASGHEPVREWLRNLNSYERKTIGEDLKTVQFGWPLGMPLIKKIEPGLWEVRSRLTNKISRVIFTVIDENIILLHGFIKKSQKLLADDLRIARQRLNDVHKSFNAHQGVRYEKQTSRHKSG